MTMFKKHVGIRREKAWLKNGLSQ